MNSLKTYRGQVPDRTALFSRSLRNCPYSAGAIVHFWGSRGHFVNTEIF